ncbi:hypothetical protein [Kribbella sp. CA-294648]|uniref:hypothetical protein n=1 Tax=Kribbella sp. CA-294648 TaxID=3239948 RepID=UPI003D94F082
MEDMYAANSRPRSAVSSSGVGSATPASGSPYGMPRRSISRRKVSAAAPKSVPLSRGLTLRMCPANGHTLPSRSSVAGRCTSPG